MNASTMLGDASIDLSHTVRHALGKQRRGLLPLLFQLMAAEEEAFG